jgi:hypothetical protein
MSTIAIGSWGLYPWFEEHGEAKVHPEDLEAFRRLRPYGKVFLCVDTNGFLTLRYNSEVFRLSSDLFRVVPNPQFTFGQNVVVREKGSTGTICGIEWHHAKKEHIFFIEREGRSSSRRFAADELDVAST